MSVELGICRALAWEKLRVARGLRGLPVIAGLFRDGRLGWSKVRALTRIAVPDTERALAAVALDRCATDVVRFCEEHRARGDALPEDEAAADAERRARRSLTWRELGDGTVEFRLVHAAEDAMNFRRCLERAEERLFAGQDETERRARAERTGRGVGRASDTTPGDGTSGTAHGPPPHDRTEADARRPSAAQRRADAVLAMAEASLAVDGVGAGSAERHQVVVHVDAEALEDLVAHRRGVDPGAGHLEPVDLPVAVRVALQGGRSITTTSVERMLCDASLVKRLHGAGGETSLGRRTRVWPEPMRRAILDRDGHACRFPGCGATRWLDVHHMTHWLLGGETSVANGITCCRGCHRRLHEEGWSVERLPAAAGGVEGAEATARHPDDDDAASASGTDAAAVARLGSRLPPRYRFTRPGAGATEIGTAGTATAGHAPVDRGHDANRCAEPSGRYGAIPTPPSPAPSSAPPPPRRHSGATAAPPRRRALADPSRTTRTGPTALQA